MKSFYLLLMAAVISFSACRTKEGEPGPAGETSLNKQGSVSGTITYNDDNGNAATAPFNHQYYESLEDNGFYYSLGDGEDYYEVQFGRRALKDANNYFYIQAVGTSEDDVEENPYFSNIDFSFLTIINNELYRFRNINSVDISNLNLDPATGRLTFDFSGYVYYGGESNASITGKVDVTLNRATSGLDISVPIDGGIFE